MRKRVYTNKQLVRMQTWRQENPDRVRGLNLKHFHGMTVEQYDAMHEAQSGVCAICKKPESHTQKGKKLRLAVDHDHKSGHIRGLLCVQCNTGIGSLRESETILMAALNYLKENTFVQDLLIQFAITTILVAVKNKQKSEELKKALLKIRNAISAAFPND